MNTTKIQNGYGGAWTPPFISAIICSLNGHDRISKSIVSVLQQDYRNLELIIVDDGSHPSLEQVVRGFDDERIKFYRFDRNQGLHSARAFALKQARGEFVALLDDDDWWLPGKLSLQVREIKSNSEIGLICSGAKDIYPDGTEMFRMPPAADIPYEKELVGECTIASSVLFRRAAYEEVGGFDSSLYRCGDWDCWIRLRKRYMIRAILAPLVVTFMRPGSLQRSGDIEAFGRDRWKVVLNNREEIQRLGLWDEAVSSQYHSVGVRYLRAKDFTMARKCLWHALRHKLKLDTAVLFSFALLQFSDTLAIRRIARKGKRIIRTLQCT